MTSEAAPPQEAFVWIWLPGQTSPVVAGQIRARGAVHAFRYGGSYLARDNAIPIFEPELPLRPGWLEPPPGLPIANALRDAAPDAWGRRVNEDLADIVRARFSEPKQTLEELFSRMTFNILVGNTDDHARNHAAFWDGSSLALTPGYDVCPQSRVGHGASQGMQIHGRARRSQLSLCRAAAHKFLLSEERALTIMRRQVAAIAEHWASVCDEAALSDADRRLLWRRQFLNDLAFEGLGDWFAGELALAH